MLTKKHQEIMEDRFRHFKSNTIKLQKEYLIDLVFPGFFEMSLEEIDELHKYLVSIEN